MIDLEDKAEAGFQRSQRDMRELIVDRINVHPIRCDLPEVQRTSQGDHAAVEILVVEVHTRDGLVGIGEGLARKGATGYGRLTAELLIPQILGRSAWDRRGIWNAMRATLTGRAGGQLFEAMSAIDIALWDIVGKACNAPIHALLGGAGRTSVRAYASSINWYDEKTVATEVEAALAAGFRSMKVKLGSDVQASAKRARFVRSLVGDDIELSVDANWAYSLRDAITVGLALSDAGYAFFEEPLKPDDTEGYRILSRSVPICLAAGESDFCAGQTLPNLINRSLGIVQPDVSRSGGITETWRIAELAAAFQTGYAPHVGWSGAICQAASLHLAAAADAFTIFECMVFPNPLRETFCLQNDIQITDGAITVPQGPGLGIEIDRDMLTKFQID